MNFDGEKAVSMSRCSRKFQSYGTATGNGVELSGQTLIDMQSGVFSSAATQQQSKLLMRTLINHCLGNQVLHTRQLLRDLQEL